MSGTACRAGKTGSVLTRPVSMLTSNGANCTQLITNDCLDAVIYWVSDRYMVITIECAFFVHYFSNWHRYIWRDYGEMECRYTSLKCIKYFICLLGPHGPLVLVLYMLSFQLLFELIIHILNESTIYMYN
jgi:hypothetical protein